MTEEILKLTKDTVVFSTEAFREIGKEAEIKIGLPEGVDLDSFSVRGIVTDSKHIRSNGNSTYIVEMDLGELPEKNRIIFDAYLAFLEREAVLDELKKDDEELQAALTTLEEKMRQVIAAFELLMKEAQGKRHIH